MEIQWDLVNTSGGRKFMFLESLTKNPSRSTADWLAGWLVGWLAGWLVGWLVVKTPFNVKTT